MKFSKFEEKQLNSDINNNAAIAVNDFIQSLISAINNSELDSCQIVAGLCAAIQAVCMKEKDKSNGLSLYKQAIECLSKNNKGQHYFDYFAHCVEWNKAELKQGIKGTKFDKYGTSLIGFFKTSE